MIEKDDLVIRDRGYLTMNEVERHLIAKADCIYRYQTGMLTLDCRTKERIDLLKECS